MRLNADFSQPVVIHTDAMVWQPSPQSGVERIMLDRIGDELARATSLVRYQPGSFFPRHVHDQGEEILVLSGTFSDESGDYPAGWYLRNPPGSAHQPFTREGATIFVKLRQMKAHEHDSCRIDTSQPASWQSGTHGHAQCRLFENAAERVHLRKLAPNQALAREDPGGVEVLVLHGTLVVNDEVLGNRGWLRLPAGMHLAIRSLDEDALFYIKTGHLAA